ncbi:hypothetical protein ACJQWK_00530 [Exserohilum turcicum]|uniref:Uncharacterized protein n=1 Tax=Exserohilum turcicum (strain 28A) TaxID=671987 RepID=R0K4M8_EXST2|nr:uncharacterized protein SETTUDRAFT_33601 [Exserohilum turcica Et28A]EOA83297.1 hypothetical protein SETTUDRAFT_33601 [Exserohilum turcica Et28A]
MPLSYPSLRTSHSTQQRCETFRMHALDRTIYRLTFFPRLADSDYESTVSEDDDDGDEECEKSTAHEGKQRSGECGEERSEKSGIYGGMRLKRGCEDGKGECGDDKGKMEEKRGVVEEKKEEEVEAGEIQLRNQNRCVGGMSGMIGWMVRILSSDGGHSKFEGNEKDM